jgi:uncharacterized protein YuzE
MRVRYDGEADVLLFVVREGDPVDAVEEPGGVVVSYNEDGEPVSVEFLNASERGIVTPGSLDLSLETGEAAS